MSVAPARGWNETLSAPADGLVRPIGEPPGLSADSLYADLVLHLDRELIHHGAESCLLRDLSRDRGDRR
jgi:hypothetical protein